MSNNIDKNISIDVEYLDDPNLIVRPIKNDQVKEDLGIDPNLPQHETLLWICAGTGCGKTSLIQWMLATHYNKIFNRIYFFSTTMRSPKNGWEKFHVNFERVYDHYTDKIFDNILDEIKKDVDQRSLIIIDDMSSTSIFGRNNSISQFVSNHRHYNTSIWYISHNYKNVQKNVRELIKDLILFRLPSNKEVYEVAEDNRERMSIRDFERIYYMCTKEKYNFLYIKREDVNPNEKLRKNFNVILKIEYGDENNSEKDSDSEDDE